MATTNAAGLAAMTSKIEERQRKRKLAESQSGETDAAPAPVVATTTEWQPAPGESPAEREKRIKREKRAERLAQLEGGSSKGVSFSSEPLGPTGTSFGRAPLPPQNNEYDAGVGKAAIHPSRLAAPALAKEVTEKVPREPREKTTARKKYLKRKKVKAKAAARGAPKVKKVKVDELNGKEEEEVESDSDSSEEEWEKEERREEAAKKKAEIAKKKEERKVKREAKKAELRKLKTEEKAVPEALLPKPRVQVQPKKVEIEAAEDVEMGFETETEDAAKTAEQLEREAEREAIKARKETKRLKKLNRHATAPDVPPSDHLIPTAPLSEEFTPTSSHLHSADPVPLPPPSTTAQPLLRLPSATRPAPPSADVLGKLRVHESVRSKVVVERDLRVGFAGEEEEEGLGVSEKGVARLSKMGVNEAFAVQTVVLPFLLPPNQPRALYTPFNQPRDLCVSAPTGSGKTLAYVIPIVETLSSRVVTRLRALVVLPTRDLVPQVREAFESFAKNTGLKVGVATGQHSFGQEQAALVGENVDPNTQGGTSQVDILIATPGRLMDHLRSTKGFSLQHLRFLVVDEADRLLNQSFHDWLPIILSSLKPAGEKDGGAEKDAMAPDWWDAGVGRVGSDLDERCGPSCQKLLFSATLSRDPAKIDALQLHNPIYISVEDSATVLNTEAGVDTELNFTLPSTLKEQMIFSPASHKPLYLFHLLHTLAEGGEKSVLCFTKSTEAAKRLAKLVELFEEEYEGGDGKKVAVSAYSSDLPPNERNRILKSFKVGETQMLVASDLIARGIDLPLVSHVISYDVPADMQKYVHRVGRTARAGREGEAWSLVEDQEAAPFRSIMKKGQHWEKIRRVRVKDEMVEGFVPAYQAALVKLRTFFATSKKDEDKQ